MHGAGNDYVYIEGFTQSLPKDLERLAVELSHRRFGIGGDGVILILPSDRADARMRMFNADGSESEMCGNGIRCVAKFVHDSGIARKPKLAIETGAGVLSLDLNTTSGVVDQVTVDMGEPRLLASQIPTTLGTSDQPVINHKLEYKGHTLFGTCVSMGNPHAITFVASARVCMIRMLLASTIIWKAREYKKSPTSTLAGLPKFSFAVGQPRRRVDSSTTSSCSKVAV
jgi:diaminopimelate epimerase